MRTQSISGKKFDRIYGLAKSNQGIIMSLHYDVYQNGEYSKHICVIVNNCTYIRLNKETAFMYNSLPCRDIYTHFTHVLHTLHWKPYVASVENEFAPTLAKPYYPICDMFDSMCTLTDPMPLKKWMYAAGVSNDLP